MSRGRKLLAFVMAGGEGARLRPLTTHRCKPALPFGGHHRVIDFVLSNLVNSEVCAIHVLVQYKSQSLIEHICRTWTLSRLMHRQFVSVVPPQMHAGSDWFQGTADAVCQNLHLVDELQPDVVAIFGADHIYRMDVRQMLRFHLDARADVTVATLPVPLAQANQFGICEVDASRRIRHFAEKPADAQPMSGRAGYALASMGNYLFSTDALIAGLRAAQASGGHDFGKHVLPAMASTHRLAAYDFSDNMPAGLQPFEQAGYWRDVGTIDAYLNAHLDTLGPTPSFCMTNVQWPIHAGLDDAASAQIEGGSIRRSTIGAGSMIIDAELDRSCLRRSVTVEADAQLDQCIVMERSVIGRRARIRRAIIDQDNHIPPGETIGFDLDLDRKRFTVSDDGVVVVPRRYYAPVASNLALASVEPLRAQSRSGRH